MSYIRPLNNPESLYVYSDGKIVHVIHGVEKPHSSGRAFGIPERAFDGAARRWAEYRRPASYRGVKVEELAIEKKTGKVRPSRKPCGKCKPARGGGWFMCGGCVKRDFAMARKTDRKIRLSYKNDFVNMWGVSWEYMISRFRK